MRKTGVIIRIVKGWVEGANEGMVGGCGIVARQLYLYVPVEDQCLCTVLDSVELNVVLHQRQHLLLIRQQQPALHTLAFKCDSQADEATPGT